MNRSRAMCVALSVMLGLPWSAGAAEVPQLEAQPVSGRALLEKYPRYAARIQAKADDLRLSLDYDEGPELTRRVPPQYPQMPFIRAEQGTVLVMFVIDETGRVADVEALESAAGFDDAAATAVMKWEFTAARKGGEAVGTVAIVAITFRMFL